MKTTIESSGRMQNPAHPGEILKEMYMAPLGVTITQTADALGVSRVSCIGNRKWKGARVARYGGPSGRRLRY